MSIAEPLEVVRPAGMLRHWKIVLGLLVVFVAGIVIGSVGTVRAVQRAYVEKMNSATWTPRAMAWLNDELTLTAEQESQARPAVEKMTHELIDLRSEAEARRKDIYGRMLIDVAAHLTPEQQERLKTVIRKSEKSGVPSKQ